VQADRPVPSTELIGLHILESQILVIVGVVHELK
jgi:hypothetical protein